MVDAPRDHAGTAAFGAQHRGHPARVQRIAAPQRDRVGEVAVQGRRRVEAVAPPAADATGEQRVALSAHALLGAVVDDRNPGQRQHRQQGLPQPGFRAAGEEAVDIVVVDERGHPVRVGVDAQHRFDAVRELARRAAAREHVAEAPVQREVDHRRQQRSVGVAHVGFQLARGVLLVRPVGAEAFAERVEAGAPRRLGDREHAGCPRIARVQEIAEIAGRHVVRGVDAERIDTDLADPEAVTFAQRAAHDRVLRIQVVEVGERVRAFLGLVAEVGDRRRPVVDRRRAVDVAARVVQREGPLRRRGDRHRRHDRAPADARIRRVVAIAVGEEIARVVHHHVLHQRQAARVKRVGERPVVRQRAQMRIDGLEVARPVAVVAAVAGPPLVRDRWRDPHRGGAEAGDVIEPAAGAGEVAAAVFRAVRRVVFAAALVVVRRVAVVEAVEHQEVDDLVAPVGLRARRTAGTGRRGGRAGEQRQGEGGGEWFHRCSGSRARIEPRRRDFRDGSAGDRP